MKTAVNLFVILTIVAVVRAKGQEFPPGHKEQQEDIQPGIQDNSFLIEEAYNQEQGVVQHISNMSYTTSPQKNFSYTFTQEWPLGGQTHQISYTIPYSFYDANRINGLGDVLINYRYQLFASGWAYVAPRLSVILPTGSESKGLGNGVTSVQVSVPLSKEVSQAFVVHVNVGYIILPKTKVLVTYYAGGSLIWRAEDTMHFMLESLVSSHADIDANGDLVRETETVISPGLRFAMNFQKLQIVPGVGFPISTQQGETNGSLFFYLSFEHPF